MSKLSPEDAVILQNTSFHSSAKIQKLIENDGGRLIVLPPYSPDLNPIELRIG